MVKKEVESTKVEVIVEKNEITVNVEVATREWNGTSVRVKVRVENPKK